MELKMLCDQETAHELLMTFAGYSTFCSLFLKKEWFCYYAFTNYKGIFFITFQNYLLQFV